MTTRSRQTDRSIDLVKRLFFGLVMCVSWTATSCVSSPSMDEGRSGIGRPTPAPEEAPSVSETPPNGSDSNSDFEAETEAESETETASVVEPARPASTTAAETSAEAWKPPEPGSDKFDWIRLKSGEWLKGEITYMRNRTLQFDSDELNELELDWKDVVELRSPRKNTVVFEGQIQTTGTLLIRDDVVYVGGDEPRGYPRDQLVSLLPGEEKESDYWSGRISVGATIRSGNTDQTDVTARGTIWRRTPLTGTTLDYTGAITTLDGREEVNNHRVAGEFDVYLTQKFYLTPAALEYYKDRISNIKHRLTPGAGVGYWLMDSPEVDWNVGLLGAYRYTEFDSVEAGEDRTEETAAVIGATKFD